MEIHDGEAWEEVERGKMDFTSRPYVQYSFSDNIEIKPLFYSNAKILWRPEHLETPEEVERMQRQQESAGYADHQPTYVYPDYFAPTGDQLY